MNHNQRFKPFAPQQKQEESAFKFKPLDLSKITGTKRTKKVRVPCLECGRPGCYLEREVEVNDD